MTDPTLTFRRAKYRISTAGVQRERSGAWTACTLAELRRAGGVNSALWHWLREHGVTRPSPSGPKGPEGAESDRSLERRTVRLAPADWATLARLYPGTPSNRAISALIQAAGEKEKNRP